MHCILILIENSRLPKIGSEESKMDPKMILLYFSQNLIIGHSTYFYMELEDHKYLG